MNTKAPTWFLIVSIIGLLWNIIGVFFFGTHFSLKMDDAALAAFEHPQKDMLVEIIETQPSWSWMGYGVATICGFLGSIGLLMKKKWSNIMFVLSLIGIMVNNFWTFTISDTMADMGAEKFFMPTLVILIAIILLFLSKKGVKESWLR